MKKAHKFLSVLSLILFILGIILSVLFIGVASWGGMEGLFFNHDPNNGRTLTSLRCPLLISSQETARISATITNSSSYTVIPRISARISDGYFTVYREESVRQTLKPKSSVKLNWQASAEDAAYGNLLILVHIKIYSSYPLPAMNGYCGIVVLDLGAVNGEAVATATGVMAMILTNVGWWLWYRQHPVEKKENIKGLTNGLRLLGLVATIGILASFFRLWFLGILALAGILLLSIILSGQYTAQSQ